MLEVCGRYIYCFLFEKLSRHVRDNFRFYLTNLIIYQLSFIVFMNLNIQDLVLKNIQIFFTLLF